MANVVIAAGLTGLISCTACSVHGLLSRVRYGFDRGGFISVVSLGLWAFLGLGWVGKKVQRGAWGEQTWG